MKQFFFFLCLSFDVYAQSIIISSGDMWKYLDDGSDQGTAWRNIGFNDASWASGPSQLGYGDGDEQTVVAGKNTVITTYFRKTINVLEGFNNFTLRVKRDDGVVVYINGTEVFRDGLIANPEFNTGANLAADDGASFLTSTLLSNALNIGSNTIAVEIHQRDLNSSDISFDLELIGNSSMANITRGPYLQMATSSSMQLRWRTDVATNSRVYFGSSLDNLNQQVTDNTSTTEHIVNLTGLIPDTKYFYSIGSTTGILQSSSQHFFYTFPAEGSQTKARVWVTGDCGTALSVQTNVKNAFQNYLGNNGLSGHPNYVDLWLLLGDNAYSYGTDTEYQTKFFEQYQNDRIMKQSPIFPAPGNHDYYSSAQNSRIGAYYQNFTLPTNGEIGGLASGTEAYYSYNYANIHFISLDSYGTETANSYRLYDTLNNNPQIQWLKADLVTNTQKWTILYWHHPPYTMGSHNSDTEGELALIREKTIKLLDNYKVDLILCGHSHDYERTRLIKGHYGLETTFNATHNKSTSSGKYDGTPDSCPYVKNSTLPNNGIVYVVAGSAGQVSGTQVGQFPHNAMYYSNASNGGSLLLEIEKNRLDAKWIAEDGNVLDKFTIMKDVSKKTEITMHPMQPTLNLTASWVGQYNWLEYGWAAQTKVVNNPIIGHTYIVEDERQCLRDTFKINVNLSCQNYALENDVEGNTPLKFEAGQTIDAYNILQSGTNIKYDAGNTITLNPGFQVKAGAVFSAYIDGCGNLRKRASDYMIEPEIDKRKNQKSELFAPN